MRTNILCLFMGGVLFLAVGITGLQVEHGVVTSAPWYGRLVAATLGVLHLIACYGIYRRRLIAWRIGFVVLSCVGAWMLFQVWWISWPQPGGWMGAILATIVFPIVVLFWLVWWRGQRAYFNADDHEAI